MKINKHISYFLLAVLVASLAGCKTAIVSAMKQSNWENDTLNNALYDMPEEKLWTELEKYFNQNFNKVDFDKSKGHIQTAWLVAKMGENAQKRIAHQVTIKGDKQPYTLLIKTRQGERYNKNGKWSEWSETGNPTIEKSFKQRIYEHFHGPLVYDEKKVAEREAAQEQQKSEATREKFNKPQPGSEEWYKQSKERIKSQI